jgi:hypothetical protein
LESWELYDLRSDPFEKKNLISEKPETAKEMAGKLIRELDFQNTDYPLDLKTNEPVKPDLGKI